MKGRKEVREEERQSNHFAVEVEHFHQYLV